MKLTRLKLSCPNLSICLNLPNDWFLFLYEDKADYLNWVKSVVDILQKPGEVKRITSYDNYFNASPSRFMEFEFKNMQDAVKYFELPEVKAIVEKSIDKSVNHKITVLRFRGDYYKN